MTVDGATTGAANAAHQQDDHSRSRIWIGLAVCALVFVLLLVGSMIWYMEKKRCKPKDCEKCGGVDDEDYDVDTEDETASDASVLAKQR